MPKSHKLKRKVLILWYPVDANLGDYYLFNTVSDFATEWGFSVEAMDVGLPFEIIAKKAKRCDWLWFAGGGIIERNIPDVIRNFKEFHKRTRGIKYGITGLSIGEFDYSDAFENLMYWINNASFFYTRDVFSANELNRIGTTNKVKASADVVFASKDFDICDWNKNHTDVGINFRTMPYIDLTGEVNWKVWERNLERAIPGKIVGIPDQYDVSVHFGFPFERIYTPQNAVKVISNIRFGVAMRYHVVLIAARLGIVCIPIDYCPKVARLAEQLGISDLCVHFDEPEKLKFMVDRYLEDELGYKRRIGENVRKMEKEADKMFNEVHIIMEEK